jgi:glucan 1,3-beta-glucosidase
MLLRTLALSAALRSLVVNAAPAPTPDTAAEQTGFIAAAPGSTSYWVSNIQRQGTKAFGAAGYTIFRNVQTDCGAKGDGASDDTAALNACLSMGNRCGQGCDSTTITPAMLYFPPGTYVVSKPLTMPYYTEMTGDALNPPTLKAAPNFSGMAVVDSDPYDNMGNNWFTNQNNFFRKVRNFVIDLTAMPPNVGAGIHWQVAQATSLQNIRFEMVRGGDNNKQQGIFMDNGSGGFMTDLIFNGGNMGMFIGNQQFTTRNLTFNNVNTAIFMNWNWLWSFKSVKINGCKIGIDMANSPANQTVGSVILQDSQIINTPIGINSSFSTNSIPIGGGTLILDNVDFTGSATAVMSSGQQVVPGGQVVQAWAQGRTYAGSDGTRTQGMVAAPSKPAALMAGNAIFERSKPQYEQYPSTSFVSVKSKGAKGDGVTDDTQAIQAVMNSLTDGQILYFDHGAYIITQTVNVPKNIKVTGEMWPLIMAKGAFFSDASNPKAVWSVGTAGETGAAELTDLVFETMGPAPGAIMLQWNSAATTQGANGMWDVHVRIGGSAGTQLQSDKCSKNPNATHVPNPECIGAHTMFHATNTSSVYVENCWFWTSDHELDLADHNQVDIYNGRGVHIESQGPVWMYGTSSEHSVLYNYQLTNAKNIYMALIQTETPYFQTNPAAPAPFDKSLGPTDPQTFTGSATKHNMAWGLRVVGSSDVLIYGAGLYSFFDNYDQACVAGQNCQNNMVSIEGSVNNLSLFGLSTKAAVSMVSTSGGYTVGNAKAVGQVQIPDSDNRSNFCATLALWRPE